MLVCFININDGLSLSFDLIPRIVNSFGAYTMHLTKAHISNTEKREVVKTG